MSRAVRVAVNLAALMAGLTLLALPAGADSHARIVDTGWWWRAQSGVQGVALPPPGNVEEGQLLVQGAPDGAAAIAAIEVELPADGGDAGATLSLKVAEGGDQGGADAVVLACAADGGWSGVEAGRWDTKPAVDCSTPVEGVISEDGTTWDFAVTPLRDGARLSLVILPGLVENAPPGLNGSTFSLVFEAPTPASVRAGGTPGDGGVPTGPPPDPSVPTVPPPDLGFAPPGGFPSPGDVGTLTPAPLDPVAPGTDAPAGGEDPAELSPDPISGQDRSAARVLGALLATGGALAAAAMWQPRSAVASATAGADGGLGRFRRIREGDPVPLG